MLLRPDLIGTNRELIRSPGIPTLSPSDLKRFLCWGVSYTRVSHSSHLDLQQEVFPQGRFSPKFICHPCDDDFTEDQDSLFMPDAVLGTLFPQGTRSLVLLFSLGGRRAELETRAPCLHALVSTALLWALL